VLPRNKISCNYIEIINNKKKEDKSKSLNFFQNLFNLQTECKKHVEKKDNKKYWSNISINKKSNFDLI